jgi:hypothetical protein
MKTKNIKQELNKHLENLRRKNQTGILEIKSPYSQKEKKKQWMATPAD